MKTFFKTFLNDESGASAAEYALILAVVGVAIGGAALVLAGTIGDAITGAGTRVEGCAAAAAAGEDECQDGTATPPPTTTP